MKKLEIYIHIPFCIKKCDYCDFLSAPSNENVRNRYVESLIKEIALNKKRMEEYVVDTVFFGGGTPSILEGEQIALIMQTLRENANISLDAEITIECNPGTVTEEKLELYKESGINRISFGLQSANNDELKSIGRIHTYEQFLESFNMARKVGFYNINVDIMSALPGQNIETYRETVKKVLQLNPEHISSYSLIVEEGTVMEKRVEKARNQGRGILPDEDDEREMYYLTEAMLKEAGYERYEISNYAKTGKECRHNVGYWQRVSYLGFGIGAASLYMEERESNISNINEYMEIMERIFEHKKIGENDGNVTEKACNFEFSREEKIKLIKESHQKLSAEEQMEEFMFLGLRLTRGVSVEDFERRFHVEYDSVYGSVVEKLINQKLIEQKAGRIWLTEKGTDVSNYVMSEFV